MKHRCLLPFHHIAIRPNDQVYPCCQFRWENTPQDLNLNHPDVFNHSFMQDLRQQMIDDKPVEGCTICYESEKRTNGTESMRLTFAKELGFTIPIKPVLTHLDLALSNVCNNRCRMCNPELSTNWYSDAKKLGNDFFPPVQLKGIKQSKDILENYDFKELRFIKLIGGEPLMEEEKFIRVLQRCNLDKLYVLLTTNSTIIPSQELADLLRACGFFRVNLSIDAYGDLNNFLRKGSKWENVVKVMDWFVDNFPDRVKLHSIISIYNINNFYELSSFVYDRYKNKVSVDFRLVDGTDWMQARNLPSQVKDIILNDLRGKVRDNLYKLVEHEMTQDGDFAEFLRKDSKLNELRNEDWRNINTQLYNLTRIYYD